MGEGRSLSGSWDGIFTYPDVPEAGPVTPFLAKLTDKGGVLNGTIMEPHEFEPGTVHASLLGQRIGRSVHFAKDYLDAGWEYRETVLYFGTVSEDGDAITGEWRIDHWRGGFEMVRQREADVPAESVVAAEA